MASLRTWRTVTSALLLLVLATTGTPAIAEATSSGHQQRADKGVGPLQRRDPSFELDPDGSGSVP